MRCMHKTCVLLVFKTHSPPSSLKLVVVVSQTHLSLRRMHESRQCGSRDMLNVVSQNTGPEDSPYEGGEFHFDLNFPDNFPYKPPRAMCRTKIYHPNIKKETGELCQDVYKQSWTPAKKIDSILDVILSLLKNPNLETPLEEEVAKQYQ